jgi:hypothetical protein
VQNAASSPARATSTTSPFAGTTTASEPRDVTELTDEESQCWRLFTLDRMTWPVGGPSAAPVEEFELD